MPQAHDHLTRQLYQEYHKQVSSSGDVKTYMHFGSVSRTNAVSQQELLTSYMKRMIDSILGDISQHGDCWLLQAISDYELPAIHVLDASAIMFIHTAVFEPENRPVLNTRSIPYTTQYSSSAGGLLYTDRRALSLTVDIRGERLLHHLCRALRLHARTLAMQGQLDAAQQEKAALNTRINELQDQLFGAQRELTQARKALQDSASAMLEDEKTRLLDEAKAKAAAILEEARAEHEAAEALSESLMRDRQAHEEAVAAAWAAQQERIAAEEAAMRQRAAAAAQVQTAAARETLCQEFAGVGDAAAYTQLRSDASDITLQAEQRMTQQLADFSESLGAVSGGLMQQLQQWRASLFRQDAGRLPGVYASLYAYTTRKLDKAAAEALTALDPERDAQVIDLIGSMQTKCAGMLVHLEAAMRDLGMELFTPASGEVYDDTLHLAAEELPGETVHACRVPGVRMAGENGMILRRAEVLTRPDSDEI